VKLTSEQIRAITAAIWLLGTVAVSVSGWLWPVMLVVVIAGTIAQAFVDRQGSFSMQWGFWIGCWALSQDNIRALFLLIALTGILGALINPAPIDEKPLPDPSLSDGF
jgi:hypothetical protein